MRQATVLAACLLLSLSMGCFYEDAPVSPGPPSTSRAGEYSMTHAITSGAGTSCDGGWGTAFHINDMGLQKYGQPGDCWGNVTGTWSGTTWTWIGIDGPSQPSGTPAGCMATTTYTQVIDFSDPGSIVGSDEVVTTFSPECGMANCRATWTINGAACSSCAPCP